MHHATTLAVPERTCSREDCATLFVFVRAESFDMGCNSAAARQQQDVQAHARRR